MQIEKIKEKGKIYLTKLQNLPEQHKKIIMWTIVAVLGLIMGIFWFRSTLNKIESLEPIKFEGLNLEMPVESENNTQIEIINQ
jgi:hypothetical protein